MNILVVASKFPPEYSGPGIRIPKLYNAISKEINLDNLYVYCNSTEFKKNSDYEHQTYPVRRRVPFFHEKHKSRLKRTVTHTLETLQALKEFGFYKNKRINLVHIIGHSGATAAAIYWAKKHNIPVIMELVNADSQPSQRWFAFQKIRPTHRHLIITISNALKNKCLKSGIKEKYIWSRPNPVDEDRFFQDKNKKQQLRSQLTPFSGNDIILLSIAKFIHRKNHLFLLDVLKELPDKYKLVLVGPTIDDGQLKNRDLSYIDKIGNKIKEFGLTERVMVKTDFVNSADYIKASDLYMLPGVNEGLGTPMLESIACGVPVIANTEPAFQEWIRNGENGYTCNLDVELWISNIEKALSFSDKKTVQHSKSILEICGHRHINKNYIKWIEKITNEPM